MDNLQLSLYARTHNSIIAQVQQDEPTKLEKLLASKNHGHDDLARALREAADKGHEECARILLERGALPNLHDASGFTSLVIAARKGHAQIIKLLLSYGVNLNKPTFRIRATALHWAATNGHYYCVRTLLAAGANTECCTVHSRTPLMLAARSDQSDVLTALIEAGANVNARDYERATALHLAAEEGSTDCVTTLIQAGCDVNAQTRTGDTPIIKACKGGHPDVLKRLIRKGGDVSRRGRCMTAAHWAAEYGHVGCLRILVSKGFDPDEITEDSYCGADFLVSSGVTPIMLAARGGYSEAVELLVSAGAVIDRVDEDGRTPLLYAVHANHPHCVKALLMLDADPNGVPMPPEPHEDSDSETEDETPYQAERGLSPLFLAIKRKTYEVLFVLLRANCSVTVIGHTSEGEPVGPLEFALSVRHMVAVYSLLAVGAGRNVINPHVIQNSLVQLLASNEEQALDVMDKLGTPPTLREACRLALRAHLGRHVVTSLPGLPLPASVIRYLEYDEFEKLLTVLD